MREWIKNLNEIKLRFFFFFWDLCMSSLHKGHDNLFYIVPLLSTIKLRSWWLRKIENPKVNLLSKQKKKKSSFKPLRVSSKENGKTANISELACKQVLACSCGNWNVSIYSFFLFFFSSSSCNSSLLKMRIDEKRPHYFNIFHQSNQSHINITV